MRFPIPNNEARLAIWKSAFPPDAPTSDDVAFDFLSVRYELTGGSIKSISLASAFLSAESDSHIEMRHIIEAINQHIYKLKYIDCCK